jgi:hypothetical protein
VRADGAVPRCRLRRAGADDDYVDGRCSRVRRASSACRNESRDRKQRERNKGTTKRQFGERHSWCSLPQEKSLTTFSSIFGCQASLRRGSYFEY